jgi:hypothetical protein
MIQGYLTAQPTSLSHNTLICASESGVLYVRYCRTLLSFICSTVPETRTVRVLGYPSRIRYGVRGLDCAKTASRKRKSWLCQVNLYLICFSVVHPIILTRVGWLPLQYLL